MITVKRKIGFEFSEVQKFNTKKEAVKYCEGILKRTIRKNKKANSDLRPNAFGAETLPWFMINNEIYESKNDPRL